MTKRTTTLSDLLSDLRAVADGYDHAVNGSRSLRAGAIDGTNDLLDLGWIELCTGASTCRLSVTDEGLDVLFACRGVVIQEADAA